MSGTHPLLPRISHLFSSSVIVALVSLVPASSHAQGFSVLYTFTGENGDGGNPTGRPVLDAEGNLYGATENGGLKKHGAAYKLSPGGAETVLHSFGGAANANPMGGLIADATGNLYGTTFGRTQNPHSNRGAVFEFTVAQKMKILYSFPNSGLSGGEPIGNIVMDGHGNLFGTTEFGGDDNEGVLYELSPPAKRNRKWMETVLHSFNREIDGGAPQGGLAIDADGNLYGTTFFGGPSDCGTVFKVTPAGLETVLYAFTCGADGATPYSGVALDAQGNLYGTTYQGGDLSCQQPGFGPGCGVLFKITPNGNETVLHNFTCGSDGCFPYLDNGVVLDGKGNIYGTTSWGGIDDYGVVYQITPDGSEKILHTFTGNDGKGPGTLILDGHGNVLGTAMGGGLGCFGGCGTIFKLTP